MALTVLTRARQSQWDGQACTMNRAVWMGDMMRFTSTQLNWSTVFCSHLRFSCTNRLQVTPYALSWEIQTQKGKAYASEHRMLYNLHKKVK